MDPLLPFNDPSFHNSYCDSINASLFNDSFQTSDYENAGLFLPAPHAIHVENLSNQYHLNSTDKVVQTIKATVIGGTRNSNQTVDETNLSFASPSTSTQADDINTTIVSPANSNNEKREELVVVQSLVATTRPTETRQLSNSVDKSVQKQNLLDSVIFEAASKATAAIINRTPPSSQIPLSVWFRQSFEGRHLLLVYNSTHNGVFNSTNRNEIVRLVLDREYDRLPQIPSITPSRFIRLRDEIIELFPRELPGTYYTPHVNKTLHSKAIPAKGKLLYHHNFRKGKQTKQTSSLLPKSTESITTTLIVDSSTEKKLDFLSKNLEPWLDVVTEWKSTFIERQKILKSLNDVQLYFDKFPCLKQPLGYQLLECDFNELHSDKADCLVDKWSSFRQCIIELLQTTREPKSESIKDIVLKFPTLQGDALDLAVAYVLPSMIKRCTSIIQPEISDDLPKRGRKRKHQESLKPDEAPWNPSTAEVTRGFLFHITTLNNKEEDIDSAKEFMRKKKIKFQPRPIIVGPLEKPESIEVLVNKTYYQAGNILEAIKIAFYVYFSLGLQYPPEAKSTWILLQKVIFDINTDEDKNLPITLTTLIGDIKVTYQKLHPQ